MSWTGIVSAWSVQSAAGHFNTETHRVQGAVQCHGLALSQPGQYSLRLTISTQTHRVQGIMQR